MPSVAAELALAAARVRLLAEQLPEERRPGIAKRWGELLDELEDTRSDGGKVLVILAWRSEIEGELCGALVNAPLEGP